MAVSYEELMEKKLDRIDDRRDKRQGSLIYDALAPNAAETAQFYADLDLLADRTFADTAVGEDLTRRAAERGMLRKGAVKATFYGRFLDADGAVYPVENGTRFALEEYKYIVLGREADGRYILEERDVTLEWKGSANQRVIDVKKTLQLGQIVLHA